MEGVSYAVDVEAIGLMEAVPASDIGGAMVNVMAQWWWPRVSKDVSEQRRAI